MKFVLLNIDPKADTPERLKAMTIENSMDSEQWIFLQGIDESAREFANIFTMKYKKITPLDFSHSNIISVSYRDRVL